MRSALPTPDAPRHDARTCRNRRQSSRAALRWGSILMLVVVVIAMLTLSTYNFSQSMTTELAATSMFIMHSQAKASADSGIEFAAAMIGDRANVPVESLIHNPQLFASRVISASPHPRGISRFSIIAPVEHDSTFNAIRYGLVDESAKINLNMLPYMGLSIDDLHNYLLNIPNMTQDIIDALVDWVDTDDTANAYGAESDTYQAMVPPYKAKNGPFESIDELLLVKGITPTLLYGEDANRNGLLDPNENDGPTSPPYDNADGVLDRGFAAYFTVLGRESNRRKDGTKKLNINGNDLKQLYTDLQREFPSDNKATAQFIIGYRINGARANSRGTSTTNPPPTTNTTATTSTAPLSRVDQQVADGLVALYLPTNGVAPPANTVKTDDELIDVSAGGKNAIDSLWQLFGSVTVQLTVSGGNQTLKSPWADLTSISTTYPDLYDRLTVTKDEYLEGRININLARREVLMTIPTMTEQIADSIITAQQLDGNGQPNIQQLQAHATTSWLYAESIVDAPGMAALDPFITTHGDVYHVQSVGFFDGGGPVARIEAVIDGTLVPPRIKMQRDLNELGRGYSRMQILPFR